MMVRPNNTNSDDCEAASDATSPCPTCGEAVTESAVTHPFCSKRCRQIDLGKWLSGDYVISRPIEQRDLEEGVD